MKPIAASFAQLFVAGAALAQAPAAPPDAAASDPRTLNLMQGFPPPADKTIRFGDGSGYRFPNTRWSFSHQRELVPTASVWRSYSPVSVLPRAERNLDTVAYKLA